MFLDDPNVPRCSLWSSATPISDGIFELRAVFRCERRQGRAGEALQLASRALSLRFRQNGYLVLIFFTSQRHCCRPECSSAMMAKRRAEAAVAVGRPLGWGVVDGEEGDDIKFIDDTDTVCSSV